MKRFHEPSDEKSMYQRMVDGEWYIADEPAIHQAYTASLKNQERFNHMYAADPDAAQEFLRSFLGELGEGAHVRAPIAVDYGFQIFIGEGTFINFNLTALDPVTIHIGKNCQIGPNVQLYTPIHPMEPEPRAAGWEAAEPIVVEDNVWLGGGVVVCPGVRIGHDSVIGAGSVVTRDIPPRSFAAGSPARVIRSL